MNKKAVIVEDKRPVIRAIDIPIEHVGKTLPEKPQPSRQHLISYSTIRKVLSKPFLFRPGADGLK
jgi:hypothetical protein